MIEKLSRWIARHPKTIFLIACILLVPSVLAFFATPVNYDIMTYLPKDLESVQGEQILDEVFQEASSSILMIENMDSADVLRIKTQIEQIDGVSQVLWVDSIADVTIPKEMLPDVLRSIFYSSDGSSTMMMIFYQYGSASDETMESIRQIRTVMNKQCFLSGLATLLVDTRDLTDSQAPIYVTIAIVLALIVLSFTMNSWVLPIVVLLSLGFAVVYNMGTNIFFGGISFITQSIAAILQLGVTMDYSVFLIDRFNEERAHYPGDNARAMAEAIRGTFTSVLGSSLTTVFGFLALCFMTFTLGMDIGLVMAKGVLLGILTVITVLPSMMLLFFKPIYRLGHRSFVPRFGGMSRFSVKHRRVLAIILLVLIVPMAFFSVKPEKYYNVVDSLPPDLSSVAALKKLKTDFNMASTHFILIDADLPAGDASGMIAEIRALDGIEDVIALNAYVGPAISENILPEQILAVCEKEGMQMMMVNSSYDTATDACNAQVDALNAIVKKYDPTAITTGEGIMSKDLIEVTDRDFKVTNFISIAAIMILIGLVFRSVTIPFILVAMIEFSIFVNEAIPFFTGTSVSFIAPTVVSCVQLGATVDYAILMTTRFREELRAGKDKKTAIIDAASASCQSIFQSALVFFSATFGVYLICDIAMVKGICAMLARGSVISALVIMLILPAVLYLCEGMIRKTSHNWVKTKPASEGDDCHA